jgi:hypothetical protein
MKNTPLKIEVNQTVFVVIGESVAVCRSDQPQIEIPFKDIINFVHSAACQDLISIGHDEVPADGLEKGLPLIGRDKLVLPTIGPADDNSPCETGVLGTNLK